MRISDLGTVDVIGTFCARLFSKCKSLSPSSSTMDILHQKPKMATVFRKSQKALLHGISMLI